MDIEEAIRICRLLCGNKNKKGKREYQIFSRMQMELDYSVDEMAEAIETVLEELEIEQTNNEILQGELGRIGIDTLKLEKGSSTDDIIDEIKKKDAVIDEMAEFITDLKPAQFKKEVGGELLGKYRCYNSKEWKQYFEKKAEDK